MPRCERKKENEKGKKQVRSEVYLESVRFHGRSIAHGIPGSIALFLSQTMPGLPPLSGLPNFGALVAGPSIYDERSFLALVQTLLLILVPSMGNRTCAVADVPSEKSEVAFNYSRTYRLQVNAMTCS